MTTAKRAASDAGQTETQSSGVVPSRTGEGELLSHFPKNPTIDDLWDAVEQSLKDAEKALPVLMTVLPHAMIADEMLGALKYAMKALPVLRRSTVAALAQSQPASPPPDDALRRDAAAFRAVKKMLNEPGAAEEDAAVERDALRYRWLMANSFRMSEPLYDAGAGGAGHRVSVVCDVEGEAPWATVSAFNAAIDAAIAAAKAQP